MSKIRDDELAVRLTSDISGGLGNHKEGTVLRELSESAYMTLVNAGGHEALKPGTEVRNATDASEPVPAPTGTRK